MPLVVTVTGRVRPHTTMRQVGRRDQRGWLGCATEDGGRATVN